MFSYLFIRPFVISTLFFKDFINPNSLQVIHNCKLEPSLKELKTIDRFQFERLGYFCLDSVDSKPNKLVFNRIVSLRDSWAKIEKASKTH
ncbi:MAG: hypothetical protein IIA49_14875 [Bacteroidetes bacterium]|nr:hypothetical protein [Bacteroidota bacterium]